MSWWRKEEEEEKEMAEEEAEELKVVEEDTEKESIVSYSPLSPQTSSTEQVQELNNAEQNWFWGWLSPFSLFSGLTTLADRKSSPQKPICCLLDKKRPPGNTCSECEILFCRKCEGLHYNPGFIEHCILGHGKEEPAGRGSGLLSPILSASGFNKQPIGWDLTVVNHQVHGLQPASCAAGMAPGPALDSINLAVAPGGTEDEEIKRK